MTAGPAELAAVPWRPPEPRELPEWRAKIREYTCSNFGMLALSHAVNAGNTAVFPTVPGTDSSIGSIASVLLSKSEEQRLAEAQLYYATGDMTSLALAAASVPPTEDISQSRLPSPYGFMVFAEPIGGYTQDLAKALGGTPIERDGVQATVTTPIVAVSWGMWEPRGVRVTGGPPVTWYWQESPGRVARIPDDFAGVWLTFYSATGHAFEGLGPDTVIGTRPDGTAMVAGDVQSFNHPTPLNWDNETIMKFGAGFGEPQPDTTLEWCQVVYTAWQLMSQTGKTQLTEVDEIPRDRAGRKRDRREGITGSSDVRVVNVHSAHRPSRTAAEEDTASSTGRRAPQWACRWPVRPYRRNTCLNPGAHADGACTHEDRIVPPHIKGPADKPLRVGETVRLWDHQPD